MKNDTSLMYDAVNNLFHVGILEYICLFCMKNYYTCINENRMLL